MSGALAFIAGPRSNSGLARTGDCAKANAIRLIAITNTRNMELSLLRWRSCDFANAGVDVNDAGVGLRDPALVPVDREHEGGDPGQHHKLGYVASHADLFLGHGRALYRPLRLSSKRRGRRSVLPLVLVLFRLLLFAILALFPVGHLKSLP